METTEAATYQVVPGKGAGGEPLFTLLVKRTYDLLPNQQAVRAATDTPITQIDEYYDHGDATWASVKYETDLFPYKAATDVVVIAKAYAPGGEAVPALDAVVDIADRRKVIRVIGDRTCIYMDRRPPMFTEPVPFAEMEIRYEKTYGGKDLHSIPDLPFYYPRNPIGTGLVLKNTAEGVQGLRLPNLEDPADLLTPERVVLEEPTRWNQQPLPQGFGWFARTWYPRCSFVGAMPAFVPPGTVMREERLGLVPAGQVDLARRFKLPSYDVRFNTGASPGLALPYLRGDEQMHLTNLTPEGTFAFALPGDRPRLMLDIGLGENELEPVLHTVCVRVEERQVDLVWGGAHSYPGVVWLPEMKKMNVEVA
ncbi:MAG TPA: DUF2169 domain-containing protein [Rhodothermales bacterium]|nr:DUF2169 domain-containing protein [Rhodothermales bacterium]